MSEDQLRWLLIGVGILFLILIIVFVIIILKRKSKLKENSEFPELLEALGGVSNISNVLLNGSRVSLNFDSKKNIDKDQIKENGVETIVVANKKITLVVGRKASAIYKYLVDSLKKA